MDDRCFEAWRADAAASPLYAPLLQTASPSLVLGRIAQSLDGRIATMSGQSRWISGREDICHTHRLRALVDAVLVGAGTVEADDPLLTTREIAGPSPVRVVIDPTCRLPHHYNVFNTGPKTLLVCHADAAMPSGVGRVDLVRLPGTGGDGHRIAPAAVLAALAQRGLRRVLIEGGGNTVSRFLAAGLLDRLHVTIAPLLLGSGIPAFTLPEVETPAEGIRLDWTVHRLGGDILLDIPLRQDR